MGEKRLKEPYNTPFVNPWPSFLILQGLLQLISNTSLTQIMDFRKGKIASLTCFLFAPS